MKRLRMCIAALGLILGLSAAVGASDEADEYEYTGISFPFSTQIEKPKGFIYPSEDGAVDIAHHVYATPFYYIGIPAEEAREILLSDNVTEEQEKMIDEHKGVIAVLFASEVGRDEMQAAFEKEYKDRITVNFDEAEEIGSAGSFTFYCVPGKSSDEFFAAIGEEYTEEFKSLEKAMGEALKSAEFFVPKDLEKELDGMKLSFTTTDLDGNTVTSEDLFSSNKITMINCWGTWCGYCVGEMEDLIKVHDNFQKKGCGIVGMEWESVPSEETYDKARSMLKEWGTNYPNVLMPKEVLDYVRGFPTSIFVDKDGNVLTVPVVGPYVGEYENILDALLSGTDPAAIEKPGTEEAVKVEYHVNVSDADGPVAEVTVQFCDENTCRMEETDENGTASFDVPAYGAYEVHVLDLPDGYKEDETVYHTTDGSGEVDILLEKAA